MLTTSAQDYTLPYFRQSVEQGFQRYGSNLARNIILSHGQEAVEAVKAYLSEMLASFVTPKKISKHRGSAIRDEYVFELVQQARESNFPGVRIFVYDYIGRLSLFTAAVVPESLNRAPLKPEDYIGFANAAYWNIVSEQRKSTGDAASVYFVLADKTSDVAEVLLNIAGDNIRMHGRILGRPFLTLEQIASGKKPYDIIEEAEAILAKPN